MVTGLLLNRKRKRKKEPPARPGDGGGLPPSDRDGGDGGGGRGGGGDGERSGGGAKPAWLGLGVAMLAIGTLFLVFLASLFMMRNKAEAWPPPGLPLPPEGLWISTLILLASSATMHRAVAAARNARAASARSALGATLLLGVAFLGAQLALWRELFQSGLSLASNAYGTVFYSLTGLHGLHLLGGLIFLALLWRRSRAAGFLPAGIDSVRLAATYWHFLDAIWVVLFAALYFLK